MAVEKVTTSYLKKVGFEQSFTIILNQTIDLIPDNSALGIYLYLARKPQDWVVQEKDLMYRFNKGRDHIRKCMGVLQQVGLLEVIPIRSKDGRIKKWETILHAQIPDDLNTNDIQITEKPHSGKTTFWKNRHIQKKELLQNKELIQSNNKGENFDEENLDDIPQELEPDHAQDTNYPMPEKFGSLTEGEKEEGFDEFWKEYGKNVSKARARLIWLANDLYLLKDKIIDKLRKQKSKDKKWKTKDYIPNPANYLEQRRWEDDIEDHPPRKPTHFGKAPEGPYFDNSCKWAEKLITR